MRTRYLVICLVLAGCGQKPSVPTVALSADVAVVNEGECTNLNWSSMHATEVSVDQGVGTVDSSGSREVCPGATTQYTITATGAGGSKTASTTVSVTPPAPSPLLMIFSEAALFESGKADLKPEGMEKIREYREMAEEMMSRADLVLITGYTDNVGEPDANVALSLRRAEAVRDQLISLGADPAKFQVNGAGEANPVADNSTEEGRAQNRRVVVDVIGVEQTGDRL